MLSGDEIKQTMSIWDTHPDILDDEGNFNGYNPEDDLPPVEMEAGTIVVHDEGEVFPPKRITDETVVLLSREKPTTTSDSPSIPRNSNRMLEVMQHTGTSRHMSWRITV